MTQQSEPRQSIATKRVCRVLLFCLTSLAPAEALADVRLASVFTDNIVLQRQCKVPIWGTADPGTSVDIRLGDFRATATSDAAGRWIVELDSMPANSKPQSLVVTAGGGTVTCVNVLVGDVWLCSGQSNMQMTLHESDGGDAFAKQHGGNPLIRLLSVPKAFNSEMKPIRMPDGPDLRPRRPRNSRRSASASALRWRNRHRWSMFPSASSIVRSGARPSKDGFLATT